MVESKQSGGHERGGRLVLGVNMCFFPPAKRTWQLK